MRARLVRLFKRRKMEAPGMTKQRLIRIIVCIEIVLFIALLWVSFK
jgi:hypothetical protein